MKKIYTLLGVVFLLSLISATFSCKKDKPAAPVITTTAINDISYTTATSGGIVANNGGATVVSRGVCWSTSANPTISNNITSDPGDLGAFVSKLTNLLPNTNYYVKAYATNSAGTGYGDQVTFTTSQVALPVLITTPITAQTQTSAISGGNITSDNGGSISARGVCWATATNPSIADNKTNDGAGSGSFVSNITGLISGTTYYIKSYATNSAGTSYGNEITFTTQQPAIPILTTTPVTAITQTTATSGGTVTSDGASPITERGICWSTIQNPTTSNSKVSSGIGTGTFSSNISGLNGNTTYYVRAYATNIAGTAYGNELSFLTGPVVPTVSTRTISSINPTTATSGGSISNDGGADITARGVCFSTNQNPTISDNKTSNGSGVGSFISNITGLIQVTTYHLRAYATNIAGTGYGSEITFTTLLQGTGTVVDQDSNVYKVITIGTQIWMADNLKSKHFNDGTSIPLSITAENFVGMSTSAITWYNDNADFNTPYGLLYNWFSASADNLCPVGWHVPTNDDLTVLVNYLGGLGLAGGKLKETGTNHWASPNTGATNESGFTALPGGEVSHFSPGSYQNFGLGGYIWSSTTEHGGSPDNANYLFVGNASGNVIIGGASKNSGFSVRCINNTTLTK